MIKISEQHTKLPDMRKALKGFEDKIPIATAQAITFTAERVQKDLVEGMQRAFDSPKPYTLNAIYKTTATPNRLHAQVKIKDEAAKGNPAAKYLQPQIEGGKRRQKGSERNLQHAGLIRGGQFMVPGDDAPLDQHGNLRPSQVVRALSHVRAQWDPAQNTGSERSKKRARRSAQYFWMPGIGIYWRQGKSLRSFMVVARSPQYRKRFDFFGIAAASVERHLPEQFQRSIDRVLRQAAGE